ncbi:MAG: LamG domain-containing protein, partial [Cytophagales bacterium]|nr:LamG domain-containing protein [Cytophagales bacterium]
TYSTLSPVPQSAATIEMWVKRRTSAYGFLFSNNQNGTIGTLVETSAGGTRVSIGYDGGRTWIDIPGDIFGVNQWHHFATTYDGNTLTIYLDGNQIASQNLGYGVYNSANPLILSSLTEFDEVKIFDQIRTQSQILSDMGSTMPDGSYSYFNFEETSGQTLTNQGFSNVSGYLGSSTAVDINDALRSLRVTDNSDNSSLGTLRWAIDDANTDTDTDYIDFSLPSGIQTIQPTSSYSLDNPVFIDGFSQLNTIPGENSKANTNPFGQPINAKLNVEINGALAGSSDAFLLTSNNAEIKGLVVNGYASSSAFNFSNAYSNVDYNKISGCFIGTNRNGTAAVPNFLGFQAGGPSPIRTGNIIGGVNQEDRNLISGNSFVMADFNPWSSGLIQNNYIGTDALGNSAIPNTNGAISGLIWSSNTTITSNVISGNGGDGINIGSNFPSSYMITANRIGTLADGT